MSTSPPDRTATVWAATFIPSKSPFPEYGADGYCVAWVDTEPHGRIQVLVDGILPTPGTVGRLVSRTFDDQDIEMFSAAAP